MKIDLRADLNREDDDGFGWALLSEAARPGIDLEQPLGPLFERNRTACGTPGLLSEEYDIDQRQMRGNLPQAFVHALLLECSIALSPGHDAATAVP
jgi:hypothetical protein